MGARAGVAAKQNTLHGPSVLKSVINPDFAFFSCFLQVWATILLK